MSVGDGDVVRGVLSFTMVNGDIGKTVWTWRLDKVSVGDYTDSAIAGHVTDAIEKVYAEVVGIIKSTVSFDTVDVYKRSGTEWDYLDTKVPSITPTDSYDAAPAGVALLMTAYTALNRVFGRKFIYGVTEAQLGNTGTLVTAALTALADAALEYITEYNGGSMGALDYLVPGVWSSKAAGFVPFGTVAVVKDVLSYQRRRKSGVGV